MKQRSFVGLKVALNTIKGKVVFPLNLAEGLCLIYLNWIKRLGFTQYELLSVSGFKSAYSIRLYELAIKLLGMKNQKVEIDELRRILQLDDKYQEFKILKRDVINLACNEINEKSDLLLNIEPVKLGRKIVALEFQVAKKVKSTNIPRLDGMRKIHGVFEEIKTPTSGKRLSS